MTQKLPQKVSADKTTVVSGDTTVQVARTNSSGASHKPNISVIVTPNVVGGFVTFLREHAIVGLAVGFVIGTQVQAVVKQLVASFLIPLFNLLFGTNLMKETFRVHWHGREQSFQWGAFVYGLLNFLFVLFAIYILIKVLKLDKLDAQKK